MEINWEEFFFFHRQSLTSNWEITAFKKGTIGLIGVGALGCEIAKDLALTGVGKILLIDFDKVEYSNLSRQFLFQDGDNGKYKVNAARDALIKLNPFYSRNTEYQIISIIDYFQNITEQLLSCDLLIGALDSYDARASLMEFCLEFNIPLITGSSQGLIGNTCFYEPWQKGCYVCNNFLPFIAKQNCFPAPPPKSRLDCALLAVLDLKKVKSKPESSLGNEDIDLETVENAKDLFFRANEYIKYLKPPESDFTPIELFQIVAHHFPTLPTTSGIIGSTMANEALKYLQLKYNLNPAINDILQINKDIIQFSGLSGTFSNIKNIKRPNCQLCSTESFSKILPSLPIITCTFTSKLDKLRLTSSIKDIITKLLKEKKFPAEYHCIYLKHAKSCFLNNNGPSTHDNECEFCINKQEYQIIDMNSKLQDIIPSNSTLQLKSFPIFLKLKKWETYQPNICDKFCKGKYHDSCNLKNQNNGFNKSFFDLGKTKEESRLHLPISVWVHETENKTGIELADYDLDDHILRIIFEL